MHLIFLNYKKAYPENSIEKTHSSYCGFVFFSTKNAKLTFLAFCISTLYHFDYNNKEKIEMLKRYTDISKRFTTHQSNSIICIEMYHSTFYSKFIRFETQKIEELRMQSPFDLHIRMQP